MKRLLLLLAIGLSAFASIQIKTVADISGDGAAHALSTVLGSVNPLWIQLMAPSGNASVVRWGDSSISSTQGGQIPPGGGQFIPSVIIPNRRIPDTSYSAAQIYYLIQSGDKLTVVFAQ